MTRLPSNACLFAGIALPSSEPLRCSLLPPPLLHCRCTGRGADGARDMFEAYKFSLEQVGQDVQAGYLYQDCIHFLSALRPGTQEFAGVFPGAIQGQEDSTRMVTVR